MLARFFAVLASVLTILVFGAAGGLLGPLLPAIGKEFNIRLEITGSLLAVTFAGSILAVTAGGYLADRYGKKPLFLIALAGLTLSYALFTVAPSFAVIIVACLLAGALGVALEGLCSAVIADVDPAHSHRNMNLLQVTFSAGAVLSIIASAWMLQHGANWRGAYTILGAAAAASWLVALFMRVPPAPHAETMNPAIAWRVISDRAIVLLALAICFYVGSEMSLAWWISPMLEAHLGYPKYLAMLGAALFWFSMGIGRVLSSILCHYFPGERVLQWHIGGGLFAYGILLLPGLAHLAPQVAVVQTGHWPFWVGTGLAGFTFSGVWPLLVSLGNTRYPAYSGTVVAILVSSGTLGGLILPFLTGFILERISLDIGVLVIAAVFALLAVVVHIFISRYAPAAVGILQPRSPASGSLHAGMESSIELES
ncbi:MAG: MFS transporter [Armatimonadota bacterium]